MITFSLKELSEVLGKEVKEIRLRYDGGENLEVLLHGESWPIHNPKYPELWYHCSACNTDFAEPGRLVNPSCRFCGSLMVKEIEDALERRRDIEQENTETNEG